jgi:hypothetical protein
LPLAFAAIGHPWPGAANPASMPGCPLRRTSTRPLDGARRSKAKARRPAGRPDREAVHTSFVGAAVRRSDLPAMAPSQPTLRHLTHRHRRQAGLLQRLSTSARDWLASRPPSLASQLLQGIDVCLGDIGWLPGRHR